MVAQKAANDKDARILVRAMFSSVPLVLLAGYDVKLIIDVAERDVPPSILPNADVLCVTLHRLLLLLLSCGLPPSPHAVFIGNISVSTASRSKRGDKREGKASHSILWSCLYLHMRQLRAAHPATGGCT